MFVWNKAIKSIIITIRFYYLKDAQLYIVLLIQMSVCITLLTTNINYYNPGN